MQVQGDDGESSIDGAAPFQPVPATPAPGSRWADRADRVLDLGHRHRVAISLVVGLAVLAGLAVGVRLDAGSGVAGNQGAESGLQALDAGAGIDPTVGAGRPSADLDGDGSTSSTATTASPRLTESPAVIGEDGSPGGDRSPATAPAPAPTPAPTTTPPSTTAPTSSSTTVAPSTTSIPTTEPPPVTVNEEPEIARIGLQLGRRTEPIDIPITVSDPDGDQVTVNASGLPPGLALGPGGIGGRPTDWGSYEVTVTATDDNGGTDSERFTLLLGPCLGCGDGSSG